MYHSSVNLAFFHPGYDSRLGALSPWARGILTFLPLFRILRVWNGVVYLEYKSQRSGGKGVCTSLMVVVHSTILGFGVAL